MKFPNVHILGTKTYQYRTKTGITVDRNTGNTVKPPPQDVPIIGTLLPLSDDDLKHDIGGQYTTSDYKFYTKSQLAQGQQIVDGDDVYLIMPFRNYKDRADFRRYIVRKSGDGAE